MHSAKVEKKNMSGVRKLNIPILMYHAIVPAEGSIEGLSAGQKIYAVDEWDFTQQIHLLAHKGLRSIKIPDLPKQCELYNTDGKYVVITFDDGYVSDYEIASRHLQDVDFKAIYFVTVEFTGKPGYMDWKHIKELNDTGHLIGSHGMTHRYLSDMDDKEIEEELARSKEMIEDRIGAEVNALSLPGGKGDMRVVRLARKTGYSAVCTSSIGTSTVENGYFILNRMPVRKSTTLKAFSSMVEFSPRSILRRRIFSSSKKLAAKMLGNRRYDTLRERILTVIPPR